MMSNKEDQAKDDNSSGIKAKETESPELALLETTEAAQTERIEQDNTEENRTGKDTAETDAAGVVQGVGHQLRAARMARSMSVGEVSRQLRLSVKQIEAIEKEDFEKLHGRTFLRGFVRNYANLLQLDPAPILQLLPTTLITEAPRHITHQPKTTPYSSDRQWSQRPSNKSRGRNTSFKAVMLVLLLLIIYGISQSIDWRKVSELKDDIEIDISLENESMNGQAIKELQLPLSPAISTDSQSHGFIPPDNQTHGLVGNDQGILHFKFNDESWVEIKDSDNKIIFKQINAGGTEQIVSGKYPLTLVIGKAADVDLTYNNKLIDLAPYTSKSEGIARLTLE